MISVTGASGSASGSSSASQSSRSSVCVGALHAHLDRGRQGAQGVGATVDEAVPGGVASVVAGVAVGGVCVVAGVTPGLAWPDQKPTAAHVLR